MAMLASQSKGGFYATPVKEIQNVARGLDIQESNDESFVHLLDPCCGKGEALSILQTHLQQNKQLVCSYGVELEKERAEEARSILDNVMHEGFQDMRTEANYSALWLNPPYDNGDKERLEERFLRTLTSKSKNVLLPKALLMFCIPQYVLKSCATLLASRFHDLKVYRFTDKEYDVFKQIVVFGYYGRPKRDVQKETAKWLKEVSAVDPSELETTDDIVEGEFIIPVTLEREHLFRAGKFNIEEMTHDLVNSSLIEEAEKRLSSINTKATMKAPLLPLKPAHGGIAVASGAIGGNMGTHLITGITKPVTDVANIYDEEGNKTREEHTKHFKSVVRVFNPELGIVDLE